MESFNVSQEIDLSYIEEKIEKSIEEKKKLKKASVNHPVIKRRKENTSNDRKVSCCKN